MKLAKTERKREKREFHILHKFKHTTDKLIHAAKKGKVAVGLLLALSGGMAQQVQAQDRVATERVVYAASEELEGFRKQVYDSLSNHKHHQAIELIDRQQKLLDSLAQKHDSPFIAPLQKELDMLKRYSKEHLLKARHNGREGFYRQNNHLYYIGRMSTHEVREDAIESLIRQDVLRALALEISGKVHQSGKRHLNPHLSITFIDNENGQVFYMVEIMEHTLEYNLNGQSGSIDLRKKVFRKL